MKYSAFLWNNCFLISKENLYLPVKKLKQKLVLTACSNIFTFHSFLDTLAKRLCSKCDRKGLIIVHSNRNLKGKQIIFKDSFVRENKLWKPTLMCNVLGEVSKVVHEWVCALSIPTTHCFLKINRIKNPCWSKLFAIKFQINAVKIFASVKNVNVLVIKKSI